jgi:SAM-dependent methyltransferase
MSHEHLRPPEELSSVGGGGRGYEAVGKRWRDMLTSPPEGLAPNERVLDAGCGVGRIAVPLTGYMSSEGSYEGFDIEPQAITWCRENITPSYPNFQFQVADIYNKRYNPGGTQQPYEYRFPYPDDSFDFAFLASVFTHLLPDAVDNYLSEISRVLRSGGRCAISYFLLNEHSIGRIEAGKISKQTFSHNYSTYRLQNDKVPEAAIAHDENNIRSMYEKHGLRVMEPVKYGSWAGGEGPGRQDVIWAVKN